jgi:hypothetical protein
MPAIHPRLPHAELLRQRELDLPSESSAIELMHDHEPFEIAITEAHRYQLKQLLQRQAEAQRKATHS